MHFLLLLRAPLQIDPAWIQHEGEMCSQTIACFYATCNCFNCIFCARVRIGLPYNILVFAAPAAKIAAAFSKVRVILLGNFVSPGGGVSTVVWIDAAASDWTAGNEGGVNAVDPSVALLTLDFDCVKVGVNDAAAARKTKGAAEARNSGFAAFFPLCGCAFFPSVFRQCLD